jgi:hypothetical protein
VNELNTFRIVTSPRLSFCLMQIRTRQASNLLDKIYSVLSLLGELYGTGEPEDISLGALIVDYNAPVQDVHSSLVNSVVLKTKKLHILGASTTRASISSVHRLQNGHGLLIIICIILSSCFLGVMSLQILPKFPEFVVLHNRIAK